MNRRNGGRSRSYHHNRRIVLTVCSILAILLMIFVLIKVVNAVSDSLGLEPREDVVRIEDGETAAKEEEFVSVSFMATGDNLIHNTIYQQAAARADGDGYDFSYAYNDIAPIIQDADLVFVNQETPVATSVFEPSNYPLFNTPEESVTALRDAGFNLFNLASNHTLDKGVKGMEATIDFMDTVPNSTNFGLYRNYTDEHTPRLVEVNGTVFSFIGITEMTNGMSLPVDTEMDIVYTDQTDKIAAMIDEAEAQSDVVVLSVHWGDENILAADQRQKDMAVEYADMGADLIIGHHPHVLQEIETITTADGREVPVVYSLGNFISAMSNKPNHIGGFFGCTITRNTADDSITIDDLSFTPIVNYFSSGYQNMRVVPFSQYTDEMAASHGLGISRDYVNEILAETVGTDILTDTGEKATDSQ
ncbi:MAG: CapA family protein [Bacillota bacterium]|nr:CapA family protein [Bacillota bacterium]